LHRSSITSFLTYTYFRAICFFSLLDSYQLPLPILSYVVSFSYGIVLMQSLLTT